MPVAPVSKRSRGNEARDDHDLKTSKWQEDKLHETVGLDETSTQNERGGWNSRSEPTRAARAAFAIDNAKDKVQDENEIQSHQNPPDVHSQATRGRQNHIGTTTLREKAHVA